MRTRQGETICLGFWIRPASADFPLAGGVWGGMRAGFGLGVFGKKFSANNLVSRHTILTKKNGEFQVVLCLTTTLPFAHKSPPFLGNIIKRWGLLP